MTVQVGEASTSLPTCSPQGPRTRRQKRLAEEGSDCLAVTTKEVTNAACNTKPAATQTLGLPMDPAIVPLGILPDFLAHLQTPRIRRRKTSATTVSLFVRWYNPSGKTKVSHLPLKPIETVDALQVAHSTRNCRLCAQFQNRLYSHK